LPNVTLIPKKMSSTENANAESHYLIIVVAIVIILTGVYLRFADFKYAVIVANIIFIAGIGVSLKGIFGILK
jgi:hypothetical protein